MQCLLREASHIERTVTVVVDIVFLYSMKSLSRPKKYMILLIVTYNGLVSLL